MLGGFSLTLGWKTFFNPQQNGYTISKCTFNVFIVYGWGLASLLPSINGSTKPKFSHGGTFIFGPTMQTFFSLQAKFQVSSLLVRHWVMIASICYSMADGTSGPGSSNVIFCLALPSVWVFWNICYPEGSTSGCFLSEPTLHATGSYSTQTGPTKVLCWPSQVSFFLAGIPRMGEETSPGFQHGPFQSQPGIRIFPIVAPDTAQ